jgi:hypothetical protein
MLKSAALSLAALALGFFVLINAIYAIRNPTEFLRARWTFRRGLTTETPLKDVRLLGVVMIAVAALFVLAGYSFLMQIIQSWSAK